MDGEYFWAKQSFWEEQVKYLIEQLQSNSGKVAVTAMDIIKESDGK